MPIDTTMRARCDWTRDRRRHGNPSPAASSRFSLQPSRPHAHRLAGPCLGRFPRRLDPRQKHFRPPTRAPAAVDASQLVTTALALAASPIGTGGTSPAGFDCSGFTQYVYATYGIVLPRDTREQYQSGDPVDDVAPGDLLFFTTTGPGPTHVGIAIGGGAFVHAPSSSGVVRVERLDARYWSVRYLGARRIRPAD